MLESEILRNLKSVSEWANIINNFSCPSPWSILTSIKSTNVIQWNRILNSDSIGLFARSSTFHTQLLGQHTISFADIHEKLKTLNLPMCIVHFTTSRRFAEWWKLKRLSSTNEQQIWHENKQKTSASNHKMHAWFALQIVVDFWFVYGQFVSLIGFTM